MSRLLHGVVQAEKLNQALREREMNMNAVNNRPLPARPDEQQQQQKPPLPPPDRQDSTDDDSYEQCDEFPPPLTMVCFVAMQT